MSHYRSFIVLLNDQIQAITDKDQLNVQIIGCYLIKYPLHETNGSSMDTLPPCPQCQSEFTYQDGEMMICPECAHEWPPSDDTVTSDELVVRDANGNLLQDGDTVVVIKDLNVKGSSSGIK